MLNTCGLNQVGPNGMKPVRVRAPAKSKSSWKFARAKKKDR